MSTTGEPDTGHEYDGIREHDNRLPRWWLLTLYGAIGFSFVYWLAFHTFDAIPTPRERFAAEVAEADAARLARAAHAPSTDSDDALAAAVKDAAVIDSGRAVYTSTCLACHGPTGGGLVGPNLTDAFWVHGGKPSEILQMIRAGNPIKGMPAWGPALGDAKTREVAVFLLTMKDQNVAGGKAPEGKDAEGNAAPPLPPTAPPVPAPTSTTTTTTTGG